MVNSENLLKQFIKDKKLQRLSNSLVLIIPKIWIKSLNWNQNTKLTMTLNPTERNILIIEKKKDIIKNGEEISELVTI